MENKISIGLHIDSAGHYYYWILLMVFDAGLSHFDMLIKNKNSYPCEGLE